MKSEVENIKKSYLKILPELKSLNEYLYENPELGLKEFKAKNRYCELLENYQFKTESNICNIETAFIGKYSGTKKGIKIALLAEYDALPEIGHGCGHNILGVTSLGAAIILKEYIDQYGGEISLVGTPAEETNGAKVDMANEGIFDDIDIAMIVHPTSGDFHYKSTTSQAMEALQFTFKGKTSHAAGAPHKGINALDGVLTFFNSINVFRQKMVTTDRVHGIISNGGYAANIIPDIAVANFYIRSKTKESLEILKKQILNCAKGAALSTETTLEVTNYEKGFLNLKTNSVLMKLYEKSLSDIGITKIKESEGKGSTDAGDVSHVCPTIHPSFPLYAKVNGHSKELADSTIAKEAYKGMEEAITALTLTSIKLMNNPKILNKIKKAQKCEEELNSVL